MNVSMIFFKTPTCAPCKTYLPEVQRIAEKARIPLSVVDATLPENARLVGDMEVDTAPTVVVMSGKTPTYKVIGPNPDRLRAALSQALGAA